METIITIAVIAVAAVFIVRRFVATGRGDAGCSCGCDKKDCGAKDCSSYRSE